MQPTARQHIAGVADYVQVMRNELCNFSDMPQRR